MSSFEFLSVLISVVIGLGMANVLTGVGRLLHRHNEVTVSVAFVAWTLFIFHFMVIYWWTVVFGWQEWQNWNLLLFAFILTYGILLFLLSVILFPTDMPQSWDPHAHFIEMRKWFFGLLVVLVLVEVLDSYLKDHFDDFSTPYFLLMGFWIGCAITGWFSTNRRTHTAISVAAATSQLFWTAYQLRDLEWVINSG